ncbi:ubiquinone/menaquinone biosynthesis C-methylase UbiE [Methylohalomonas lacus]|uniref:Ubiquinone/menaquinone biosynthesis C-methylase UbiE n=1 Tax=Methylohalomonas lacus TaxID=398773 RepID=A0AAE3HMW7_9GAMM|nr:class I SAM-dependent methyltransferase [Methylohalomonas lacus]MCS3903403.1 ubiquinone/menaquinone biosynthesis C-methylase UbiE [Methylohalomonas lacus]
MHRIPEPELMTDPEQARAYAAADFSEAHDHFIDQFRAHFPDFAGTGVVLDLGCGPADISIRFARAYPDCHVLGIDGARAMLDEGARAVTAACLQARIQLQQGYLPGLALPAGDYSAVISNSPLHHMCQPMFFWQTVLKVLPVGQPLCVMDLVRPEDTAAVDRLVAHHAADAPAVLRHDFRHSLLAAYRPEEIDRQLHTAGLAHLSAERISDRHWLVAGAR